MSLFLGFGFILEPVVEITCFYFYFIVCFNNIEIKELNLNRNLYRSTFFFTYYIGTY